MPSSLQSTAARITAREDIARALQVLELEAEKPLGAIGMTAREARSYSFFRILRQVCNGNTRGIEAASGLEFDAHKALERVFGSLKSSLSFYVPQEVLYRDLNAQTLTSGGSVVGSTSGGSMIDVLRNRSVAFRLGAQRLPDQKETLIIPRMSASASVVFLQDETTAPSPSQQTFGQVVGTPKMAAGNTQISEKLLRQSNPAAEAVVAMDLGATAAVAADAAVIRGSGTSGQPRGIINTAGVGTFSGTTLGLDALTQAQAGVLNANAMLSPSTLGYATTPAIAKLLKGRQRFTGTDTPLWQGALHDGEIEGVRATSSLQLPDATMVYGDWSTIAVAEWGAMALEVDPYANFRAGIIEVRVLYAMDVLVRHPASFTVATQIS